MILEFFGQYPFITAFLIGLIPALLWIWFWLKEDVHPEPAKMITLSFLGGMAGVIFVLPLQELVYEILQRQSPLSFTLWAAIEELFKFLLVYFIALRNKTTADEPVDDIIYLIVSALGFATFENTLFLLEPIRNGDILGTIINGNMRFLGASLVHIMSSGIIGICMGISFYKSKKLREIYTFFGLVMAIILHTSFNLFIMNGNGKDIFLIFGSVWIGIVLLLLLFEKVKHIQNPATSNS
jgi:RsiW-degrading membrane proteinase PrsW (M82 family)